MRVANVPAKTGRVYHPPDIPAFKTSGRFMGASKTVLCVDDEPSGLLMQQMLLQSAGFRVLTASSGPQALEIFQSQAVDLVVMDYWMPGMNGIRAAKTMRALKRHVPIVFLSAFTELPGETLGLAKAWVKKGEGQPEQFLNLIQSLVDNAASLKGYSAAS